MNEQPDPLKELATQALGVLRLQKLYFRTHNRTHLIEAKDAERRLEKLCLEILSPPTPGLFDAPSSTTE
jgi:hypothetical protein